MEPLLWITNGRCSVARSLPAQSTNPPYPNTTPTHTAEGLRKKKKRKKQAATVTGGVRVVEEDEWGGVGGGGRGQESEGEGDGAWVGGCLFVHWFGRGESRMSRLADRHARTHKRTAHR